MKIYDIVNDRYITDRAEIIDRVVGDAGAALTYSQRRAKHGRLYWAYGNEERDALLAKALSDESVLWVVQRLARAFWRSEVAQ